MDISFITNYINPVIMAVCLLVGYVIKEAVPAIPNRFIPLAALIFGTGLEILTNFPAVTLEAVLGGMISGLASTGLYEMLRNLLGTKKEGA